MNGLTLAASCHFGLEAVLKREISNLGYEIAAVEDGRVSFRCPPSGIARANINLRTAERVLLEVASFEARSFDELFEAIKAVPLEEFLPKNAKFWVVKVSSVKSALFSPSDVQRVAKKAMAERMKAAYGLEWMPEDGAEFPFRIAIRKDVVSLGLDTSGASLHKRGYRVSPVIAPISETLAAGLVMLTPFKKGRILVDPFCGSGTIPIEAAMIARNIAPGVKRHFLAEDWGCIVENNHFQEERESALAAQTADDESDIQGYDINPKAVRCARENAQAAGVGDAIHFQVRDAGKFSHPKKYGFALMNPPYGERLDDEEQTREAYEAIRQMRLSMDTWSFYVITAYEKAEEIMGKADKNRKIYNGMLKTYFYCYPGAKPPKRG